MYWYISHLGGGLFSSTYRIKDDDLYCEQCGDYDEYLGKFDTEEEAQAAYDKYWGYDDDWEDENFPVTSDRYQEEKK